MRFARGAIGRIGGKLLYARCSTIPRQLASGPVPVGVNGEDHRVDPIFLVVPCLV